MACDWREATKLPCRIWTTSTSEYLPAPSCWTWLNHLSSIEGWMTIGSPRSESLCLLSSPWASPYLYHLACRPHYPSEMIPGRDRSMVGWEGHGDSRCGRGWVHFPSERSSRSGLE